MIDLLSIGLMALIVLIFVLIAQPLYDEFKRMNEADD